MYCIFILYFLVRQCLYIPKLYENIKQYYRFLGYILSEMYTKWMYLVKYH